MNKKVIAALSLSAVIASPVAAAIVSPSTAYAITLPTHTLVYYGSRGSAVKAVQSSLNRLGFSSGPVDGMFGPDTRRAVLRFQGHSHLVQDGVVGPHTWAALSRALGRGTVPSVPVSPSRGASPIAQPTVKYPGQLVRFGSRGIEVKQVQAQLNRLGYNAGPVDGIYGPMTYAAIRRFQAARHVATDGIVGPQTWPVLFAPTGTYTAYKSDGKTVIGSYKDESAAQSAVASVPGGIVKDDSGDVIYREADYGAYDKGGHLLGNYVTEGDAEHRVALVPDGTVYDENDGHKLVYRTQDFGLFSTPVRMVGEYTSQSTAVSHASGGEYVVNLETKHVVKMPGNYYSLSNGHWISHQYGWQGSQVPSFAKPGDNYIVVNGTPGQSPYEDKYYLLDNASGAYLGTAQSWTWENSYRTANLTLPTGATGAQIDNWLKTNHPSSAMYGLGSSFVGAQNYYGSNAVYLLSHGAIESAFGDSSIALDKNNLFGFGAYDANPGNDAGVFPTENYSIYYQSWFVRNFYLNPNSGLYHQWPTLDGMNQHYATSQNWSSAIATVINDYTDETHQSFASSSSVIEPKSNLEPIYFTNGFKGHLQNVPAFPGRLANPSTGTSVKELQNALNANGANLTVDGDFGPLTEAAVKAFQKDMGLAQTGIADQTTWETLYPTFTGAASIDEIMVGRMDGMVVEQYHLSASPQGQKMNLWVYAPYVQFTNVSRIEPIHGPRGPQAKIAVDTAPGVPLKDASGAPVSVHAGDYVVQSASKVSGYTQIAFTNIDNGAAHQYVGIVPSADVQFISYTAQNY